MCNQQCFTSVFIFIREFLDKVVGYTRVTFIIPCQSCLTGFPTRVTWDSIPSDKSGNKQDWSD